MVSWPLGGRVFLAIVLTSATVLFAGRLADLYPPHRIYTIGFIGIAVFYLVISFMDNSYAFYVLRAISALLAVLTIPSAINMIGTLCFSS